MLFRVLCKKNLSDLVLSESKKSIIICITEELRSINLGKHVGGVHIEKIGPAIDLCGTRNRIFKQLLNVELRL